MKTQRSKQWGKQSLPGASAFTLKGMQMRKRQVGTQNGTAAQARDPDPGEARSQVDRQEEGEVDATTTDLGGRQMRTIPCGKGWVAWSRKVEQDLQICSFLPVTVRISKLHFQCRFAHGCVCGFLPLNMHGLRGAAPLHVLVCKKEEDPRTGRLYPAT